MSNNRHEPLHQLLLWDLEQLKLTQIAETYREVLDEAARQNTSMLQTLAALISAEVAAWHGDHREPSVACHASSHRCFLDAGSSMTRARCATVRPTDSARSRALRHCPGPRRNSRGRAAALAAPQSGSR
jgi:hypothetical protein